MRNKARLKTLSPYFSLLPRLSFLPNLLPPPPRAAQRDGEWGLWSEHNASSLLLFTPLALPLLHHGARPMRYSPS